MKPSPNPSKLILILIALTAALQLAACSGKKIDESDPQELYKDAEEDITDKRYAMALDKLKALKNKFPYSHLATQSKLRIADVYFDEESFIEAAAAYESFRDMHPKHEKADYVMFRIGESYFQQLPSGVDRDLGPATKAIDSFRELIGLYPKSELVDTAKKHLSDATEKLAGKEKYIADFYFTREQYDSAAGRYEKMAARFPDTESEQYAYSRWAESLIKQDKKDEARHVYRTYLTRYPSGAYAKQAGNWLDASGGR
ncbi:MAG: outer membrane protein assembly factor BamD [Deltaproteobacteria bacterium]|nr:outer membrane protein assembly factor BamD [Deltaproteobacteria bacterium]